MEPNTTPTKREAITAEVEKARLNVVNLQSRAYELGQELKAIEKQIVPALAAFQAASNVLAQTKDEDAQKVNPDTPDKK